MADSDAVTAEALEGLPDGAKQFLIDASKAREQGNAPNPRPLGEVFSGKRYAALREKVRRNGIAHAASKNGGRIVVGAQLDENDNVMAMAAGIPRNPGRSDDLLADIDDFSTLGGSRSRADQIDQFHKLAEKEGLPSNAINKYAALVATEGSFKVRSVKGRRGQGADKRQEELVSVLNWWKDAVNDSGEEGVITGDQGAKSFISQGTRLCLIEGDHFARQQWDTVSVPGYVGGKDSSYSLPINLQTMSAKYIEIPEVFAGTNTEMLWWVPDRQFVQTLSRGADRPEIQEKLDKIVKPEIQQELIKEGRYLLDPALMIHIKHRGLGTKQFGQSLLAPAMNAIVYKRSLEALDLVSVENLINRLVIIMVGSDDADSVYHKQEVSNERLTLLENMISEIGPSAMILWAGPDISTESIGAHNELMDVVPRMNQALKRIQISLGAPSALLTGESSDGKAAGWAAILGAAAMLMEIQDQYRRVMTKIGQRIALENGFEDADIVWEFHRDLLTNQEKAVETAGKNYDRGLFSPQTTLEEMGIDWEAELERQKVAVEMGWKDQVFGPPPSAKGLTPQDPANPGGRPKEEEREEDDPRDNDETQSPEENK